MAYEFIEKREIENPDKEKIWCYNCKQCGSVLFSVNPKLLNFILAFENELAKPEDKPDDQEVMPDDTSQEETEVIEDIEELPINNDREVPIEPIRPTSKLPEAENRPAQPRERQMPSPRLPSQPSHLPSIPAIKGAGHSPPIKATDKAGDEQFDKMNQSVAELKKPTPRFCKCMKCDHQHVDECRAAGCKCCEKSEME
jgi:hypothetical protein